MPIPANYSSKTAKRLIENTLGIAIPSSTFYRLIWSGRLDSYRLGSRIIITPEDLHDFLARCERGERF